MGATPFDPGVQELFKCSLGSIAAAPPYLIIGQVNRDGHLIVKLEWALEATSQATGRIHQGHECLY
jgi:hypothetical protein